MKLEIGVKRCPYCTSEVKDSSMQTLETVGGLFSVFYYGALLIVTFVAEAIKFLIEFVPEVVEWFVDMWNSISKWRREREIKRFRKAQGIEEPKPNKDDFIMK